MQNEPPERDFRILMTVEQRNAVIAKYQHDPEQVNIMDSLIRNAEFDGSGKERLFGLFEQVSPLGTVVRCSLFSQTPYRLKCRMSGQDARVILRRQSRFSRDFVFVAFFAAEDYEKCKKFRDDLMNAYMERVAKFDDRYAREDLNIHNICEGENGKVTVSEVVGQFAFGEFLTKEVRIPKENL